MPGSWQGVEHGLLFFPGTKVVIGLFPWGFRRNVACAFFLKGRLPGGTAHASHAKSWMDNSRAENQ